MPQFFYLWIATPSRPHEGLAQSEQSLVKGLLKKLKNEKIKVKKIFSSPTLALLQTADVIHDQIHVPLSALDDSAHQAHGEQESQFANRIQTLAKELIQYPDPFLMVCSPTLSNAIQLELDLNPMDSVGIHGILQFTKTQSKWLKRTL